MNQISCVVVTYNRLNLLKECIESLEHQNHNLSHLIIVNNNSTDGTTEYLQEKSDGNFLIHINLEENLGGAGGFEKGVEYFYTQTSDDYVWLMDDDTIPDRNALHELINASQKLNNQFGFLCSNVYWKDGSPINLPTLNNSWADGIDKQILRSNQATFVSFFTRREVVKEVGYPIGELFILGDDSEYSLRISNKWPSYFVILSKVEHKSVIANATVINDVSSRLFRYYYSFRNGMYIAKKYYGMKKLVRQWILVLKYIVKILLRSQDHKFLRLRMVVVGSLKGMMFNPKIIGVADHESK